MKKITDHIAKEVVTVAEAKIAGVVTNAGVNEKLGRVKGWIVCSDESDASLFVELGRVVGDEDALTVRSENALKSGARIPCPLGAKIFDSCGRAVGILRDLVFDEITGASEALLTDDGELSPSLVIGASENAVVVRAAEHENRSFKKIGARSIKASKNVKTPEISERNAFVEDHTFAREDERAQENLPDLPKTNPKTENEISSENSDISDENKKMDYLGDYGFLLGRTLLKNVFSDGEILAKRGETVSARIIEDARDMGKLVELTVNSRKG